MNINLNEKQLKTLLAFTEAYASSQLAKGANFAETTDETLRAAEREAVAFAERRKIGLSANSDYGIEADEKAEIDEIRQGIRDYYRRSRKIVNG